MSEIKEKYLWAAFAVVVIVGSLYLRYYYQPQISISVKILSTNSVYPYQIAHVPISITNTGSATINNISMGIYVNGNITQTYKAYIPAGKQALVYYNFTPKTSNTYSISAVVDPSKLYNIPDRQSAQNTTEFSPLVPQKPTPFINFPPNPAGGQDIFYMNPRGYIATLYFDNFTKYFYLTGSNQANNFLYPAIDVFSSYISQIAVSHAYYSNYSLASIWVKGYVIPTTFDAAAEGKGMNITKINNVSLLNLGNSTTICTWYSGGWTKLMVSLGGSNCTAYTKLTNNTLAPNNLYYTLRTRNSSLLNYSGYVYNLSFAGSITATQNALYFESLSYNGVLDNTCYGNILNLSNTSYCLQALYQGNTIMNKISALKGEYNTTVWYIPTLNTTTQAFNAAINISKEYSFPGARITYVSAYANKCAIGAGLICNNPAFTSNTTTLKISLNITNQLSNTITLNNIGCVVLGNYTTSEIGVAVQHNKSAILSFPCYNYGKMLNSSIIPMGVPLSLKLNYTYNGVTNTTYGYTEIHK